MTQPTWPAWLPLRKDLLDLSPYGAPQIDAVARLNTNENPYSLTPELVNALVSRFEEIATTLNRYPDRDALALRESLAIFLNELSATDLTFENVWAANGSNEIIQSLFLAFGEGTALGFTPSYSMHPLIARVTRTPWLEGERSPDFSVDIAKAIEQIRTHSPRLTFVTTPNNPTGTSISLDEISQLASAVGEIGGLLVVDEAYAEFSFLASAITLIQKFPHLVVIRTMSKAFAFAGARIGYLAANPEVVKALLLVRLPYHLSSITQAAGLVALEYRAGSLATVDALRNDRESLAKELVSMGIKVVPSSANFLLFSVDDPKKVWSDLLEKGVLIRDVGLSGYLRVTIGTPQENALFVEALRSSIGGRT
ncbi:MAG: histidinol-phosphate transaminase [Actinobacteria bacterium]|nr:histidinol-phosphate transaminase [Actinomycetota bacterium]